MRPNQLISLFATLTINATTSIAANYMTDDNDSYLALSTELDRTIDRLWAKQGVLISERTNLKELASNISESDEHTMVSIGDGYFVSMNYTDATSFLLRQDKRLEQSINDIHSKIDFAKQMKVKLKAPSNASEKKEELNEEGLPFVEILEELDSNGNVISSNIGDPKESDSTRRSPEDSKIAEIHEKQSEQLGATEVLINENKGIISNEVNEKDDWQELMEDMGITEVNDQKKDPSLSLRQPLEKDTDEPIGEDKSGSTARTDLAIDENDMIKLELFDELADEEVDVPDNIEWDYDFEEEGSDSADDSLADEMLYGLRKTQFLPGKENEENPINKMLWDKISDLRMNKEGSGGSANVKEIQKESSSASKKSVRFSDALDIKSIENVGEQLKSITYPERKLSKFKQNRAIDKNTLPEADPPKAQHQEITEPLSDVIERDVTVGSFQAKDDSNAQHTLDNSDLDAMAQAYTRELNEEDKSAGSIVIEKLDDFEKVNALIMSSQKNGPGTNDAYNEDHVEQSHDDDDGSDIDDSDLGPILEEEIVENNDVTSEEIESSLLQEQINREYQYLSQKLRSSSPRDNEPSELVPLDENKQPVRISRFKSMRNSRYPRD